MKDATPVGFPIPDIASATDDQMEALFPSFDGRWSRQTRALLARHDTDRLNLDDNWASVPQAWRCGPCGRYKADLARKSAAGVLICRLDRHHDHLRDHGKRLLRAEGHRPADPEAVRLWYGAVNICKELIERFYPSFVCVDCNAADGEAKRKLKGIVHPDFSFSPTEIAAFITVRPGRKHDVDPGKAEAIWRAVEEDVVDRIAFTETLARRVAQGRHQRQGKKPYRDFPLGTVLGELSRDQTYPVQALLRLPCELSVRSVQNDGFRSSLNTKARSVRAPTLADFDAWTAGQDERLPWVWCEPDWTCPACDRSRFDCLRASGSGKWTGSLHHFYLYEEETDDRALRLRNGWDQGGSTFRTHSVVHLCQDCRLIITDTNKRLAEPSEACLRLVDLRALVGKAEPHARPDVDWDRALTLAEDNFDHMEAASAYWRHRSRAQAMTSHYDHLTGACGVDRQTAMWIVMERMEDEGLEDEELPAMLDFIREEGARFAAEDEAQRASRRPGAGRGPMRVAAASADPASLAPNFQGRRP